MRYIDPVGILRMFIVMERKNALVLYIHLG